MAQWRKEREKGLTFSAVLHLLWLILIVFGLPSLFTPPPTEEPIAITVELLPITGVTNVKPSEKLPEKEEEKEEEKAQPKPSPPTKSEEAPPPPEKTMEKPKEKKPEEKKPEPKKEEKKKAKEEDLAAVLKAVKDTAQKEKKKADSEKSKDKEKSKSISSQYDPSLPMSLSEKDAIMSQIAKCWNVPAGAKDAQNLVIVLDAEYSRDGTYLKVALSDESRARYSSDTFFRAAADSAIRAVKQCSPLQGLPQDKFSTWQYIQLRFDPKFMLN